MIRRFSIGLALCSVFALSAGGPARAAETGAPAERGNLLEKTFGNTILSTYPDGRQGELWLQRDGTYAGTGRRLTRSTGTWQVKGDKLCLRQHTPFPAPFSFCSPVPSDGLDKPWTGKAITGETLSIRLVKGLHGRDLPKKEGADTARDGGPKG